MNEVLFEFFNDFCQIYLYDIFIYNKNRKKHVKNVKLMLNKFRKTGFSANINKFEFHIQETKSLPTVWKWTPLKFKPFLIGQLQGFWKKRSPLSASAISIDVFIKKSKILSRKQTRYFDFLSEFNFKIAFRPGPNNTKTNVLTRMTGSKFKNNDDDKLKQMHQTILTSTRWEFDGVAVNEIKNIIFHKINDTNLHDEFCNEIH